MLCGHKPIASVIGFVIHARPPMYWHGADRGRGRNVHALRREFVGAAGNVQLVDQKMEALSQPFMPVAKSNVIRTKAANSLSCSGFVQKDRDTFCIIKRIVRAAVAQTPRKRVYMHCVLAL